MKKIEYCFFSLLLIIAMPLSSALAQNASLTGSAAIGTTPEVALLSTTDHTISPRSDTTFAKDVFISGSIYSIIPPPLNLTFTIPFAWHSQFVKVDYENQTAYGLKADSRSPLFLFSVTKVTGDQWMMLKEHIKGYAIIEDKDGFVTFAEKADAKKLKGAANEPYHVKPGELDAVVASIRVK